MARYALMVEGVVGNVVDLPDGQDAPQGARVLPLGSMASPGWLWPAGDLAPAAPPDTRPRLISKRAFVVRFPASTVMAGFSKFDVLNMCLEDATYLASIEASAPLRTALKMLLLKGRELYQQSPWVQLDGADTVAFVNALTASPVPSALRLLPVEAQAFLNGPIAEGDRYRP